MQGGGGWGGGVGVGVWVCVCVWGGGGGGWGGGGYYAVNLTQNVYSKYPKLRPSEWNMVVISEPDKFLW